MSRSATHGVLSLNHSKFSDYVDCIYPIELAIKDNTDRSDRLIPWPTHRHWQWRSVKNETVWQKRWRVVNNEKTTEPRVPSG